MKLTEREIRAFDMAATQARHYPMGYAIFWGKDFEGRWVDNPALVAEYG